MRPIPATRERMTKTKHSDHGPPERRQHGLLVIEETMVAGVMHARVATPDALDYYYAHKRLGEGRDSRRRYEAGARLRGYWDSAGMEPRVVGRYENMPPDGAWRGGWTPSNEDAYRQFSDGLKAVGPIASNEVVETCCFGRAVGRGGMEILRRGLEELCKHWGY